MRYLLLQKRTWIKTITYPDTHTYTHTHPKTDHGLNAKWQNYIQLDKNNADNLQKLSIILTAQYFKKAHIFKE